MRTTKTKSKRKLFFQIFNKSDETKIIINVFLYYGLRVLLLSYGIIRIFLINIFLGITNFGLLNVMMLITPICLFFITASQSKSNYVLYKYALENDYLSLNRVISEQIREMRYFTFISLFFLGFMLIISYFFVNSPGLNGTIACLLILGNSIGTISFGLVLPYVRWYLNSINLNFIYDIWEIGFITILNAICFGIIIAFGKHVINFDNVSYEQGSTYIVLIVTFLLSSRVMFANFALNLLKKRYMPWFKKQKIKSKKIFNKNTISYLSQQFFETIAVSLIPIVFFIFTTFIHLATAIAGIYYSYTTFVLIISLLGWVISAVKPYLAKYMASHSKNEIYKLNKFFSFSFIYIGVFLLIEFILISPYIMVFMASYFSFWFAFLIGAYSLVTVIKTIDETFIYLDGKPEKYWKLTIIEIFIGLVVIIVSCIVVIAIKSLNNNILNLLYAVLVSELLMSISKYVLNIIYLNKLVYKKTFARFIHDYWLIYLYICFVMIVIICTISMSQFVYSVQNTFTTNTKLNIFSNGSINVIMNNNIHLINYWNAFLSIIIIGVIFGICTAVIEVAFVKAITMYVNQIWSIVISYLHFRRKEIN